MAKSTFLCYLLLAILMAISLNSLAGVHSQQSPSYLQFVFNATELPSKDYYDDIIVGGGTDGCPLAATLSEYFRILVLKRGSIPYSKQNLMTQEGFLSTLTEVDTYNSPAQAFTSEDGVPNTRRRVLGGGSAINAGFYSRADQDFYPRSRVIGTFERAIVFRSELKNSLLPLI